jgi:PAS domain S-box-containing protein
MKENEDKTTSAERPSIEESAQKYSLELMKQAAKAGPGKGYVTPLRSLIIIAVSTFLAEVLIMFLLTFLPPFSHTEEAFLDAAILSIIIFPVLYFFLLKPMILHIRERKLVEEYLRYYQNHLEDLVEEQSNKLAKVTQELEEKVAEDSRAEAKYYDLYENAPDMFASVVSNTTEIVECNITFANELGYNKDRIIGRHLFDLYHPDCIEAAKKHFRTFLKTGSVQNIECQLQRSDGSSADVILNALNISQMYAPQLYQGNDKIVRVRFTII